MIYTRTNLKNDGGLLLPRDLVVVALHQQRWWDVHLAHVHLDHVQDHDEDEDDDDDVDNNLQDVHLAHVHLDHDHDENYNNHENARCSSRPWIIMTMMTIMEMTMTSIFDNHDTALC